LGEGDSIMSDSNIDQTIQFAIGPVQGFLAQARRTRDLWSGSFLLSYLSGCAMAEMRMNGTIIVPDVKDDILLNWIEMNKEKRESKKKEKGAVPPRIGTLPNRFQATAPDPATSAKAAAKRIKSSWKTISDEIWKRYVEDVAIKFGKDTKEIWDRQVCDFWEIYWTLGISRVWKLGRTGGFPPIGVNVGQQSKVVITALSWATGKRSLDISEPRIP